MTAMIFPFFSIRGFIEKGEDEMKGIKVLTVVVIVITMWAASLSAGVRSYPLGSSPTQVTLSDINNDGYFDILASNELSDEISVLLNRGDGTFAMHLPYETGKIPGPVKTADMNNDGFQDMILCNSLGGDFYLYFNNGIGDFSEPVVYECERYSMLEASDMDNDGCGDVILTNYYGSAVDIYLNNGDGTLADPVSYDIKKDPRDIILWDLNVDGYPDVVIPRGGQDGFSVLLNNGDGRLGEDRVYAVESQFIYEDGLHIDDMNGDGYPDIMHGGMLFQIRLNNGDGTFKLPDNYLEYGEGRLRLTTGDIENDGYPEVFATEGENLFILKNRGDGSFSRVVLKYPAGRDPLRPSAADLNGDGLVDIVITNFKDGDVSVLINNGNARYFDPVRYGRGKEPRRVLLADVDNDSFPDIVVCNRGEEPEYQGFVTVFRNLGDGTFDAQENRVEMNLSYEPAGKVIFREGDRLRIELDLVSPTIPLVVDIYFIMLKPAGLDEVYSGMSWEKGVFPAVTGVYIPPDTAFEDVILLDTVLPCDKPPIRGKGLYQFAAAMFESGTGTLVSNVPRTSFEVVDIGIPR